MPTYSSTPLAPSMNDICVSAATVLASPLSRNGRDGAEGVMGAAAVVMGSSVSRGTRQVVKTDHDSVSRDSYPRHIMFIPVGSDRDPRRLPVATLLIILVTALAYAAVTIGLRAGAPWAEAALVKGAFTATRSDFRWWQPLTYQFLHDPSSIAHVAFNMIFLWVFGRSVEGRIGPWWFAAFYLVGGAVAALGQCMVSSNPMIGASGAVAGATGAFAALFPRSTVRVLVIFFLIGIYEVPSLLFVGIYVAIDALNQGLNFLGRSREPVAYAAHLVGYAWGLGVAILLLATRLLPRTEMDLFAMWTQWRRRQAMRAAVRGTAGGPWASASADTAALVASTRLGGAARGARSDTGAGAAAEDPARQAAVTRLNAALAAADSGAVRDAWHALAAIDPRTPLSERTLLEA
ncbi:MAG: rhomboid family intramembrane serine protease, partial [Phycisphaerales bacterium]|nr:rhomboid family intramembrane serine protease [Phycisphaerales bacterium]